MGTTRQKVGLENIRFFAYHGFYPQEQILGNEFILDIETEQEVYSHGDDDLSQTLNYELLFDIAKKEMIIPRKLMETVAHSILNRIRHEFLAVKSIRVKIRKLNPPLAGEAGSSLIELNFHR